MADDKPQTDSDNDGLPDWWELQHALDPNDATGDNGAFGDPDFDGQTNAVEHIAGTDPKTDTAKALPISGAIALAALALAFLAYAAITDRRRNRAK
ncbi:MAG: hypothetical protein SGI88_18755 [Candidatus Hydrogenedentes bacterium]|nr:hypothetical protein [Candidatus Hydrogenedentota bacterium]